MRSRHFMRSLLLCVSIVWSLHGYSGAQTEENNRSTLLQLQPHLCCSESPGEGLTLNGILQDWTQLDQRVLQLQPGEHCIHNFTVVREARALTISAGGNGSATIRCRPGIGLAFCNTSSLTIFNIRLDGCGMSPGNVEEFLSLVRMEVDFFFNMSRQYIALAVGNSHDFRMERCEISDSRGLGFIGINLVGQSLVSSVVFRGNGGQFQCNNVNTIGGGAFISYHDYHDKDLNISQPTVLNITDCDFLNNKYCVFNTPLSRYAAYFTYSLDVPQLFNAGGGGLSLQLTQLQYGITTAVSKSTFFNNTCVLGSGAFVSVYTGVPDSLVTFDQSEFAFNGPRFTTYQESLIFPVIGSAIEVLLDFIQPQFSISRLKQNYPTVVRISDSFFHHNYAYGGTIGILSLLNYILPLAMPRTVECTKCVFEDNQAIMGPAIYAFEQKFNPYKEGTMLELVDVRMSRNKLVTKQRIESPSESSGVVHLLNFNATLSGNSTLEHSEGSALKLESSLVLFQGNVTFFNNSASYGGAIQITTQGFVLVARNSKVLFLQNEAAVAGGAIFINLRPLIPDQIYRCFLIFSSTLECLQTIRIDCGDISTLGIQIIFKDNKASLGGMVYGTTLMECIWVSNFKQNYGIVSEKSVMELFYEIQLNSTGEYNFTVPFVLDRNPDSIVDLSTPVSKLTASIPNSQRVSELVVAPGINTKLELAAFDAFNRLVPTSVTSRSYKASTMSVLGRNYTFVNYNTTENSSFFLTTSSPNATGTSATVILFTVEPYSAEWTINVTFDDCPIGFYFNVSRSSCVCRSNFSDFEVYCTDDGRLLVPVNNWVGLDRGGQLALVLCPFDYCDRSISILGGNSDDFSSRLCNPNYQRSGVGCGSCSQNLSLTLGSNSCEECSNYYLFLLIPIALYGILLIGLFMQTKLTISGGFLNSLLFFSNILSLYGPVYAHNFNSVFVLFSWLSLKIGFKTCFFDGMRSLDAAALNFVFPVYLYALLIIIYVVANKSTRFSLWLSKNRCTPAHLFVTIIVMTYSSLLESCINVLSATTVTVFVTGGSEQHIRWRNDPNQKYFSGLHGALAAFSILLLALFLVPVPFLCMLNVSLKQFKCTSRFIPFFDAMWAPFKSRYRFWISMRLLFRVFPLVFFYLVPSPYQLFSLGVFLSLVSFLQGLLNPYKGTAQNVFDSVLLLILNMMNFVSLFYLLSLSLLGSSDDLDRIESTNEQLGIYQNNQKAAIVILVILAYWACLIMFAWHLWISFPDAAANIKSFFRNAHVSPKQVKTEPKEEISPEDMSSESHPTASILANYRPATFSELRESLLEDSPATL